MTIALGVGRVAQQQQDPGVAEFPEPIHVGGKPIRRRRIELEIARVHDAADWRVDRERDRVGNGMAHGDGFDPERAQLHRIPHPDLAQVGLAQDSVFLELRLDQAQRQARAEDRDVQLLQGEGKAADVVLVAVGQEDSEHLAVFLQEVRDIGQDQVDAQHVLLGKHQPGVDDQDLLLPLERPHVDPDLAQTAEREVPEWLSGHNRRSCSDSCLGTAVGTGGGGGASSWSRYRLSWSKSCSRSATSDPLCSAAAGW